MSYIKLEHRVLNDPRILDLSAAGLTAHLYALDWCNEQATDGAIPVKVAHRMMCQLDPAEIVEAFKELVVAGLWVSADESYTCPEFLAYGLEGDEQRSTRDKWSQDKRRRRLHNIGNHALCLPESCAAKKAQGTGSTSGVDSVPRQGWTTRPDPTRPDQTPKGSGSGSGSDVPPGSADALPPAADWVRILTASSDQGHTLIIALARSEDARPHFVARARAVADHLERSIADLAERHGDCRDCRIERYRDGVAEIKVHVPDALVDHWAAAIPETFANPTIQLRSAS